MADVVRQPITFHRSGKTARNRTLKSAMTERLCAWDDTNPNACGKPTPGYIKLNEVLGEGNLGVFILGNIPCDRRYPEAKGNAIIDPLSAQGWDTVASFKPVMAAAKKDGALVLGQISHGGRQTPDSINPEPVSASDVQAPPLGGMTFGKPRPLTIPEIHDIVNRFAYAAKVLYDSGADGIQLHAAHGYLLSQFLSPRVNKRTDEYGGDSLDNRSRIVFEILEAIKKAVPDTSFILAIKINSADFSDGGFEEADSREMALRLEKAGVDLIELSGGTYEDFAFRHVKDSTKQREAFFIEFADRMRPHLTTAKLCVTGGFRSTEGMARAITDKSADLVGLARPLCAEPHLVKHLLADPPTQEKAKAMLVNEHLQIPTGYMLFADIAAGRPLPDLSDPEAAREMEQKLMKLMGRK